MDAAGCETAVLDGVSYRAREAADRWPLVELLSHPERGPAQVADGEGTLGVLLHPDRLAAWYRSRWTFSWRGRPFESTGFEGETVSGRYLGEDEAFAKQHLRRRIAGYGGVFPRAEVTDVTEEREDLLARRRELLHRLAEARMFRSGRWTFRWQGGPFEVLGVVAGRLKGRYTGGSRGFADSFQLTPEPGPDGIHPIYTLTVDLDAVTDLTQHHPGPPARPS